MLSNNQVVKVRKAIESTYTDRCTIIEYRKVLKPNKSTGFEEVVVLSDQPCRLSYKTVTSASEGNVATISQVAQLFIAPEIVVAPGSKISVTRGDNTTNYEHSGKPALYETHQEVVLELFRGWA